MNDDNDISKIDKQIQDILNTEKTVYDDNHQVIVDRKYAYDDDLHGDTKKIDTLSDLQVEEYNDQDVLVEEEKEEAIDIVKNKENINNSEIVVDENDNNYLFIILTVICCLILVFIFIILFFS